MRSPSRDTRQESGGRLTLFLLLLALGGLLLLLRYVNTLLSSLPDPVPGILSFPGR